MTTRRLFLLSILILTLAPVLFLSCGGGDDDDDDNDNDDSDDDDQGPLWEEDWESYEVGDFSTTGSWIVPDFGGLAEIVSVAKSGSGKALYLHVPDNWDNVSVDNVSVPFPDDVPFTFSWDWYFEYGQDMTVMIARDDPTSDDQHNFSQHIVIGVEDGQFLLDDSVCASMNLGEWFSLALTIDPVEMTYSLQVNALDTSCMNVPIEEGWLAKAQNTVILSIFESIDGTAAMIDNLLLN